MVYFIRCKDTGRIKIGYSANPEERFKQIDSGCPTALEMIGYLDGDRSLEKRIHRRLGKFRVPNSRGGTTEWFDEDSDAIELMVAMQEKLKPIKGRLQRLRDRLRHWHDLRDNLYGDPGFLCEVTLHDGIHVSGTKGEDQSSISRRREKIEADLDRLKNSEAAPEEIKEGIEHTQSEICRVEAFLKKFIQEELP